MANGGTIFLLVHEPYQSQKGLKLRLLIMQKYAHIHIQIHLICLALALLHCISCIYFGKKPKKTQGKNRPSFSIKSVFILFSKGLVLNWTWQDSPHAFGTKHVFLWIQCLTWKLNTFIKMKSGGASDAMIKICPKWWDPRTY